MNILRHETLTIRSDEDIVNVRQLARKWVVEMGFSLVAQTKLVTAASELARNTAEWGKGGAMLIEALNDSGREGVRLTFEDHGPGIPDIELAMKDGYSSNNGFGMGLGGSKRLVDEFDITSQPGRGTRIIITMWK